MRRERLIRPTDPAPIVGLIRCADIAAGIVRQLPDAAGTPYPAYRSGTNCRPDKMRQASHQAQMPTTTTKYRFPPRPPASLQFAITHQSTRVYHGF
ncbi:hypothetical protein DWG93_21365 [Escherichia coli]|nr:hypothetical protein [Escherichia coli]